MATEICARTQKTFFGRPGAFLLLSLREIRKSCAGDGLRPPADKKDPIPDFEQERFENNAPYHIWRGKAAKTFNVLRETTSTVNSAL